MLRKLVLLHLAVLAMAGPLSAKEWARKMFATRTHDFGTVARGARVEFGFELQNIYKEDIHISGVRSSCGCTTPSVTKPTLKTWEKGSILTKLNTRSFLGNKNATITVLIDKPFPAEVQLTVHAFIRSDVVLSPGSVEFGEVEAGTNSKRSVTVSYAGRDTWRIVNVETPAPFYRVQLRETDRGNGRVGYHMVVTMTEEAPPGYMTEQFVLVTNDRSLQKIPFTATGRVLPSVTVSPASLTLGILNPGQRVTKQLVVRSKRPFQVTNVKCDGDCMSFENPEGSKKLHFIPVTFTAGDEPGQFAMTIHIETDLGQGGAASCVATAAVKDGR